MLTDLKIKGLKPQKKPYRVHDQHGLFLYVAPNGKRYWHYRTRVNGRERRMSLGIYPEVTLAQARNICTHVKLQEYHGADPLPVTRLTKFYLGDGVPRSEQNIVEAVRIAAMTARRHLP